MLKGLVLQAKRTPFENPTDLLNLAVWVTILEVQVYSGLAMQIVGGYGVPAVA